MSECLHLFKEYIEMVKLMDAEDCKTIILAMAQYEMDCEEPTLPDHLKPLFVIIKSKMDAYAATCAKRAEAGRKSGEARKRKQPTLEPTPSEEVTDAHQEETPTTEPTPTPTPAPAPTPKAAKKPRVVFIPPELHEVREYMGVYSMNTVNSVEADKFMDFYASKGWMVGKNKMKDWRSAARQWIRRISEFTNQKQNDDNGDHRSNYEIAIGAIERYRREEEEWQRNGGDAQLDGLF